MRPCSQNRIVAFVLNRILAFEDRQLIWKAVLDLVTHLQNMFCILPID